MEHEGYFLATGGDDHLELPPGFRFHPTDEELIAHYLVEKVADREFSARAIGRGAKMGEKEWFFFSVKDRKYPTGLRTNRATDAGYWKATGKDKEIRGGRSLGQGSKGEKTNWIMHEYRLDGKSSYSLPNKSSEHSRKMCSVFSSNQKGHERNWSKSLRFRSRVQLRRHHKLLLRHLRIPPLDGGLSRFLKSGEGWVQLLQREGARWKGGGGSQSQETGLTSEMNPEISSVLSSYEVRRLCFEGHARSPGSLWRSAPR
ncbi:unnamed protein product [Spirodela intermedia]|uniref:NAC domain-containing protein n=1 Tax=Spirodela intermedia TaxID=51605 RepID=A0A7I8J596_SPIIN|nr:unnamed protein product [Spirodela intermedia]CAA6665210.1 unnamed protein product [Spirodela intermedia]